MSGRFLVNSRRVIGALALSVHLLAGSVHGQTFYPDDPLERDPPPRPAADATPRNFSLLLERVSGTFSRPGERHPQNGVIAAQGVNTLGEVPDGPWFINRHGRVRLTADELRRGAGGDPPSAQGPLRVALVRDTALRRFLAARDDQNRLYALRFDAPDAPELATGAEMVTARIFHALGYYVPEVHLVTLDRARLVPDSNAHEVTSMGQLRELLPEDIDRFLEGAARRPDGTYRATALRVPTQGSILVGPFQFFGTRSDDPNDIVPHEHRRDLRGLSVFSAWVNHTRIGPLHTADIVGQGPNEPLHIRHYLLDFMASLGSGITGPKPGWEGRDPIYARDNTVRNMASFGLYTPQWMRASYPNLPAVGRFDSATFEPDKWEPLYDLAPFANRLPDDAFWAARHVMAFTDDDIRAIVQAAEYSDQNAARWIADSLIERRNRIGRTYFAGVLPLARFAIRDNRLAFDDLGTVHGFAEPRTYVARWSNFDNQTGKATTPISAPAVGLDVPSGVSQVPIGSYVAARITVEAARPGLAVNLYWRQEANGLRLVGIDREWPGRVLVNPTLAARPARNRWVELEPERQTLFETYVRELNLKTGSMESAAERFAELTVSEQTTFDGVTHALMRTALTDDEGRTLGRALDLVTGLERIAGQDPARGGDQQFRLYVTLKPGTRETLERSREFVLGHPNTVYHVGYPTSYRYGAGVPSIQFSVSEDGLRGDIDVDYRASKTPQSLFNGHLTSANSDVRAGDNARRHSRQWNGFINWWSNVFGSVTFPDRPEAVAGSFGSAPGRTPAPLPPNRPSNASIPNVADAAQEFLADWIVRRNYEEAVAFFSPDAFRCVADSMELSPTSSPARLRRAGTQLLQDALNDWGRPGSFAEAMNPLRPWNPAVRVLDHAFSADFTMVEAPTGIGRQYECGAAAPRTNVQTAPPEYGVYYGTIFEVVREGQPVGPLVIVWRRVNDDWRIVAYRTLE